MGVLAMSFLGKLSLDPNELFDPLYLIINFPLLGKYVDGQKISHSPVGSR